MSELPPPHDPIEGLGEAYELMLERAMADFHKAEDKSRDALHRFINAARDKAVELEELTEEEADRVAKYLKRDLDHQAKYLAESGKELADWLGFDVALLEERTRDALLSVADPTVVELLALKAQAATYHTGEVAGPGTLVCAACGERLHFHRASRIPPCPKCHGTVFHREDA